MSETSGTGERRSKVKVTLTFDIDRERLRHATDFDGRYQGITVGSVAAFLLHHHDASDGYVLFTVADLGGGQRDA